MKPDDLFKRLGADPRQAGRNWLRRLGAIFITGLVAILPILITFYILIWFGGLAESLFGGVITAVAPKHWYRHGMGVTLGLVLILLAGLATKAWVGQMLFHWSDQLLNRIPVIKTLYSSTRDLMNLFSKQGGRQFTKTVLVSQPGLSVQLIGFLTRESFEDLPGLDLDADTVAVYIPMSYQVGGHLLLVPRSAVQPLDLSFEAAMRLVLTAGISVKPADTPKIFGGPEGSESEHL